MKISKKVIVNKEKLGWLILSKKSMKKMWDNKKDDNVWNKYS